MIRPAVLGLLLLSLCSFLNAQEEITWSNDIGCLIYSNCTPCHNDNGIAPFSLTSFEEVYDRRFEISEAVSSKLMPPWMPDPNYQRFEKERYLEDEQIELIKNWVNQGAPSGDMAQAPQAPSFEAGPVIKEPDLQLEVPRYVVPDLPDVDLYRCFIFDHGLDRDRYIKEFEIIPSDPSLVHHVIIFQDTSGIADSLDADDSDPGYTCFGGIGTNDAQMIGGWAPGVGTVNLPDGFGVKIEKNARIVVQLHYPEGNAGKIDDTKINMRFSDEDEDVRDILILPFLNHEFSMVDGPLQINAGEIKTFHERFFMPFEITVTGVAPHAHLVCESMKAYAVTPVGDTIQFIDIPHWDFEWQGYYQFQKPIVVPGFSTFYGEATYNNTTVNHHLPYDQPRDVSVGEATSDEMMVFFFGISGYEVGDEDLVLDTMNRYTPVELCQNSITTSSKHFQQTEFELSPNPNNGKFTVKTGNLTRKNAYIQLYDATGRRIATEPLVASQISLELELTPGLYFAQIQSEGTPPSQLKKLVIH